MVRIGLPTHKQARIFYCLLYLSFSYFLELSPKNTSSLTLRPHSTYIATELGSLDGRLKRLKENANVVITMNEISRNRNLRFLI